MAPTRPAISVLGGCATSSAPAFPSSCAAASIAAAAVRGSKVDYRCASIRDKAHHLRIFALNYSRINDVPTLLRINTDQCQSLLSTAISSIVDNEPYFDSTLRGNFGPTSTTCSASPSLSSTHYGREHLCGAEGKKALCQPSEAATEEPTAAAAAEQTPGKTEAIAAGASTSTDFPNDQSGTGRLSFRLRRLQRNAKHPAIYDSLRSMKGKAVSRLGAFSGKIIGNCAILPLRSRMATF